MKLTFGQVKGLDYPDGLSFESVLIDMLLKKQISVNEVLSSYSAAIEKERHIYKMRFEESCFNLGQILSGNFTTEDQKSTMLKHAIHTYNMSDNMATHVFDAQYNYTQDDESKWDEYCNRVYGCRIKND